MAEKLKADFTTLTLALMPVAIVINIVGGQVVQVVLKLPVYLDSIGTVLVAVLAGPLAGALTGALANILWGIISANPTVPPFAINAFVIGLVAGVLAQFGWFRREMPLVPGLAVVAGIGILLIALQAVNLLQNPNPEATSIFGIPAAVVGVVIPFALTTLALVLTARRLFPALVAAGGVLTGIVAAIVSAPIAAFVFGGVTGSGMDLLVAVFQATGANILNAVLGQSLVSDPFDKFVSFVVVWLILRGMSPRYLARFPRASNVAGV